MVTSLIVVVDESVVGVDGTVEPRPAFVVEVGGGVEIEVATDADSGEEAAGPVEDSDPCVDAAPVASEEASVIVCCVVDS